MSPANPENGKDVATGFDPSVSPEGLDVLILADRADLWATIAPGLGHDLANALMSLSSPRDDAQTRESARRRIQRARRALLGMSEDARGGSVPIPELCEDVIACQRMQLPLPRCEIRLNVDPAIVAFGDARLHHAVLALVTGAKEAGAQHLELRAQREGAGFSLEVEADIQAPAMGARRATVVRHLLAGGGGRLEVTAGDGHTTWCMHFPSRVRANRAG